MPPYNQTLDPTSLSTVDQQLQQLQDALSSGQIDYNTYQQLFNQFAPKAYQGINQWAGGGSASADAAKAAGLEDFNTRYGLGGTDLSTFASQLKNLTGAAPTAQDIQGFMQNIGSQVTPTTSYADVNALVNQYVQNQYGQQIQDYQQKQQMGQYDIATNKIQDLINQQNKLNLNYLTNPATTQALEGAYNNQGLLNSGAFNEGLANTLAQGANQNQANALGQFGIPAVGNIFSTANAPYANFLGNVNPNLQQFGQNQNALTYFNMQKDLAEQLGQDTGGSGAGTAALQGGLSGAATGAKFGPWGAVIGGGVGAAGGYGAKKSGTYLCTHLKKLGLMTEEEVNKVHKKVYPVFWFHPIDLIKYFFFAPAFIIKADEINYDWKILKILLCDRVLEEPTSEKAFQLYKKVCREIFSKVLGGQVYG